MNEVKIYGALLVALLVGAYLSWTKEDTPVEQKNVVILDVEPEQVEGITLYTKTQTIAVSFEEAAGGRYAWFGVEKRGKKRGFAASDRFDDHLKKLAPFEAERSLGRNLSSDELEQTKLGDSSKKLAIRYAGKEKVFDVGGRTSGSRDYYVRAKGGDEVFLVASKTLSDLEFPEGRFMQRKLRTENMDKVEKVIISSSLGTKTAVHKNRLSRKDSFWADESAPDTNSETLGNYVDKLDKLVVTEYLTDEAEMKDAEPVMEVTWYGENDESLGTTKIFRKGEDKKAVYFATSPATHRPVKVSRFTADQLERDLKTLIETK